ncbi:MAG: hypothetical protein KIT58_00365 [Planctomycetota bacterium]|nr:hypothetical protein [Planctomycetota bacterium]
MALGVGAWDALVHALSTLATGGYSNKSASLGAWGNVVQLVTACFMVLGAELLSAGSSRRCAPRWGARRPRRGACSPRGSPSAPRPARRARPLWRSGEARGPTWRSSWRPPRRSPCSWPPRATRATAAPAAPGRARSTRPST